MRFISTVNLAAEIVESSKMFNEVPIIIQLIQNISRMHDYIMSKLIRKGFGAVFFVLNLEIASYSG